MKVELDEGVIVELVTLNEIFELLALDEKFVEDDAYVELVVVTLVVLT